MAVITWQIGLAWVTLGHWLGSTQNYRMDSTIPSGWIGYLRNGGNAWTNVTPSHWVWNYSTSSGWWLSYGSIDGPLGYLGETTKGIVGGIFVYVSFKYDTAEDWYVGGGVPGANQIDLQSIATHEFGHGLGLDHTSGIYCPGNTNNATMCTTYVIGSYFVRTLEGDDRNGVNTLYP